MVAAASTAAGDEHLHGVRKAGEYGGDFGGTGEAEEDTATGGGDGVFGVETNHAGRLSGWIRIVAIDGICRREEAGGERERSRQGRGELWFNTSRREA